MRIGTNHGSLSDRIMSRYGDTPIGMVESAMEFLRIARSESYHQIVLSMKASNPQVMVQAYRLLIKTMQDEFGEIYPLHLGVTEAGDGEEGRIKSAVGIGTLMEDGIGDTIRVSLTEDPELEIPVCGDIVKRYENKADKLTGLDADDENIPAPVNRSTYNPFNFKRHQTTAVSNIGGGQVPVVIADLSKIETLTPASLKGIGYTYNEADDKWNIADAAADYVYINQSDIGFALPGTLKVITPYEHWKNAPDTTKYFPIYCAQHFAAIEQAESDINFVMIDCPQEGQYLQQVTQKANVVLCLSSTRKNAMQTVRATCVKLQQEHITAPIVFITDSSWSTADEHLIHYATETGALFLDGFGDGICLGMSQNAYTQAAALNASGRNYLNNQSPEQFINNTAFSILQATRTYFENRIYFMPLMRSYFV